MFAPMIYNETGIHVYIGTKNKLCLCKHIVLLYKTGGLYARKLLLRKYHTHRST